MRSTAIVILLLALCVALGMASPARAENEPVAQADTIGRTPPRLSLVEGQVSFWRPGAKDWVQAQINTALAPGDQLYVGAEGNLELQIGGQAFVRGGADAQIGLESQEPDFLQFKITAGTASFDLRSLAAGRTVEVDTPGAAFTIDHQGYYRLDVGDERTVFTTRRGGRATATPADGEAIPIAANEAVTIEGTANFKVSSQPAPPLDGWDNWNYARTDQVLEASSARYVSPGTYGVSDLDRYGTWRVVPEYGYVWVPGGVAAGWVPYSTGTWMRDPYYGWTWVDSEPWGWAPYHYGRWVYADSVWCWAPGPIIRRAVYAPALVAFYGQPGVQISIGIGGPLLGWVALGWGEPLIPWWGRPGFIHHPWWGGWHGPRLVNGRRVRHGAVVRFKDIHFYHNSRAPHALVVVNKKYFGHGRISRDHFVKTNIKRLRPDYKGPQFKASPANYVPTTHRGIRPPQERFHRSVVTRHGRFPGSGSAGRIARPLQKRPPTMRHPAPPVRAERLRRGHDAGRGDRSRVPMIDTTPKTTRQPRLRSMPRVTSPRPPAVPRHGKVKQPEPIEVRTPNPPRHPAQGRSFTPQVVRPRSPRAPSPPPSATVQRPFPRPTQSSPLRQGATHGRPDYRIDNPGRRGSPAMPAHRMEPSHRLPQRRQMESNERPSADRVEPNAPRRNEWRSPDTRERFPSGGRGNGRFERRIR